MTAILTDLKAPTGGSFLVAATTPDSVFTPEDFWPEARLMADTADEFLRREVLPVTGRIEDHDLDLMASLMHRAGELGLLGAEVPEIYGGLGLDNRTGALLAEKLNWQQSFALTHEAHTVIATLPLLYFGNREQKSRYLPRLASGEWIGAFALSEPGSGSDALAAQTRATLSPDGTHYVLNGTKMWITNTAFADLFTVFAKVDGVQFNPFLVERGSPGLSYGKEEHKLGMQGTSTRRLILDNVTVPVENVIGEVGKGHYAAFCALNMGRFKLEAGAVGGLKETIAQCARYATERKQFGHPLADFGLIQAKLGEMAARTFALESAVYRLAGMLDGVFGDIAPDSDDAPARYHRAAEEYAIECCAVKVVGSELYSWATDEAIQIHGGYGYTEEFPVARAWRDQRLLRIGEGANEVVRLLLVKELLRRNSQGRLPLDKAIAGLDGTVPDSARGEGAGALRSTALRLLESARHALGDRLLDEQEVVAAIADIAADCYLVESAWLRANRIRQSAGQLVQAESAANAALVCQNLAHERAAALCSQAARRLNRLHLQDGAVPHANLERELLSLLESGARQDDVIGLRRSVAQAVLSRRAYPW